MTKQPPSIEIKARAKEIYQEIFNDIAMEFEDKDCQQVYTQAIILAFADWLQHRETCSECKGKARYFPCTWLDKEHKEEGGDTQLV